MQKAHSVEKEDDKDGEHPTLSRREVVEVEQEGPEIGSGTHR